MFEYFLLSIVGFHFLINLLLHSVLRFFLDLFFLRRFFLLVLLRVVILFGHFNFLDVNHHI